MIFQIKGGEHPIKDFLDRQKANAEFIVTAVNHHDELVSLLKIFVNESMLSYTGDEMARELISKLPQ